MAYINSGQALAAGAQALHQLGGLGLAELGVDQDGVMLATDHHRADREDGLAARVVDVQRQRLGGNGNGAGEQHTGQQQPAQRSE